MSTGSELIVFVNGELVRRSEAKVSVFDASFQSGDAVWEGIRVYHGRVFQLDAHLDRLYKSSHAVAIEMTITRDDLKRALFETLCANDLYHDAHVRLMVTRGERRTSGMDPRNTATAPTVVIIAEHKPPIFKKSGIRLMTSSIRRPSPDTLDGRIHHANQLNSILAKIEANRSGMDDAIMLDQRGFVAETNSANLFIVSAGQMFTPFPHACLPGVTRRLVLQQASAVGIPACERDLALMDVHTADEVFLTGTVAEIVPVIEVDERRIGTGDVGPVTKRIAELYRRLTDSEGEEIPRLGVAAEPIRDRARSLESAASNVRGDSK